MNLYPIQFHPILKERIWGGTKLKTVLGKDITSDITGESWELSGVKGDVSVVANGEYEGKSLQELLDEFPNEILGEKIHERFGNEFPLLFKFLDAREDLSIQVHPNDDLAKKRHNSFGKTEMWYVMQADFDSRIIVGFKHRSRREEYLFNLQQNSLLDILDTVKTKAGDVFFLETGTVHAIGAGVLIAEIQQTSDITYRLYDFDRKDANGNKRDLHVDLALDAINYEVTDTQKSYSDRQNEANTIVDCPYFHTSFIPVNGEFNVSKNGERFTVYMCVEGHFSLEFDNKKYEYKMGDTVLVPAAMKEYKIDGFGSVLEVFVP
ncbi:class I mannose-6-phosphate isomerase [Flavobacterium sp. MAH-1]|uniref:Phosphohexomutase n=1 Tax=Flavobacterium agri TaxID=2743471 RepID=A0A7Y9C736_9FLAO|nr:type I phosphomannose isomerase catalytic subunit [Flavobacterium agri]NUY80928.1 class I mannose-6-phosphate isomerase [Flavobacterium agri]NYA70952.1 class I mannose-6-phosphate isomerase [Flavobacterium agri]